MERSKPARWRQHCRITNAVGLRPYYVVDKHTGNTVAKADLWVLAVRKARKYVEETYPDEPETVDEG